jgi:WD40 repeat protein
MMRDAKRFILFGKTGIEIAPLQIYASTLLLSPETSLIKQLFLHERPAWIEHCSGVETFWSPLLQTIEATISEESPYNAVFSPDGSLVASFAKHDRAIGIWSAETGTLQRKLECSADDGTGRVVFSPQNHWVAVAGWDNEVQLWSLDDESECKTLEGHTEIRDIAFSHTGKLMACASEKNYIRIWDMEDLPSHRDLKDHGTMVVFAPTDDQLASASSDDHTIRIWNVKTGAQINAVNYQSGLYTMKTLRWKRQVRHLMRDPGPTNAIQLWDSIGQKLIFSVEPNDMLPSYDMSPDESCLVALPNHDSYNIEFWDIATRNRKNVFKMHDEAYDCNFSFSNDGTQLAIINSHRGGPITLLNVMMAMNNSEEDLSEGHRSGIELLFFSKDGKQLVSLSSGDQDSATVCLWDVKSGLLQWPVNILGKCSALALTPDGRYLMANSYTDTIPRAYMLRIWNTATGILVYEFNCGDLDIHTKSFSQDGSWLALPCDETIKLWNIDSKKWYDIDSESGLPLDKVFFSPNSRQIVACSRGRMFLWEMKNSQLHEAGKETVDIEAHHLGDGRWLDDIKDIRTTKDNWLPYNDIMSLSFSCDGCWLAIIFRDETVSLLDIKNGGTRIPLDLKDVQIIRFSPDGNFFATSSGYRFVQFWDFKSKALIREIEGHPNSVSRMTFSKDGNQIIILGGTTADPMIRILDVETLEIRDELRDYESKWSRGSDVFRYRYRPNRPTDRGTMMLERAGLRSPYSISKDGSWITWHGHRVLWLPREYRPERLDIQENAIAMGFHSGRVVTFSFADDDSAEQPRPQCASQMRIGEERH